MVSEVDSSLSKEVKEQKLTILADYILENGEKLKNDILDKNSTDLLTRIIVLAKDSHSPNIRKMRGECKLIELMVLLAKKDVENIKNWIIENKEGFVLHQDKKAQFIKEILRAKELLNSEGVFSEKVSSSIALVLTNSLGLRHATNLHHEDARGLLEALSKEEKQQVFAHWIEAKKIPLVQLSLSEDGLFEIAPFLTYVDCTNFELDNLEKFISSCKNAHTLILNDKKIKHLTDLPNHLTKIKISESSIETINLTQCTKLKEFEFINSPNLTSIDFSNNHQLILINCNKCPELSSLGPCLPKSLNSLYCANCDKLALLPIIPPQTLVDFYSSPCLSYFKKQKQQISLLEEIREHIQKKDTQKIKELIIANNDTKILETFNLEFLNAFSKARELLQKENLLDVNIGSCISKIISAAFNLIEIDNPDQAKALISSAITDENTQLEVLTHWINEERISLDTLNLTSNQLETIAPLLQNIEIKNTINIDTEKLISLCSNAYKITLRNSNIGSFQSPSPFLDTIHIENCINMRTIDISTYQQLKTLRILKCPLQTIDLTKNKNLETIFFNDCALNLLESLDLSQNLELDNFSFENCPFTTLDLSHNKKLTNFKCLNSPNILTLDFSENPIIMRLSCQNCPNLFSLGSHFSNTLRFLNYRGCPNITQMPEIPETTITISGEINEVYNFEVNPELIKTDPKQVLLNLGQTLLRQNQMPKIIYTNPETGSRSPGIDAGGLSRQFMSVLCENLFRQSSSIALVGNGNEVTPLLSQPEDLIAIRTFARLMGFALKTQKPLGINQSLSFYQTLFALSDQELDNLQFDIPLHHEIQEKLYMASIGFAGQPFDPDDAEDLTETLPALTAIAFIAKELKTLLGDQFRPLETNIDEFKLNVEGLKVTKEDLKNNIVCNRADYKKWIDELIDRFPIPITKNGQIKEYELKHFLLLLNGSYTLTEKKIDFKVIENRKKDESDLVLHTCSGEFELPGDLTQEDLTQELLEFFNLLETFNAA